MQPILEARRHVSGEPMLAGVEFLALVEGRAGHEDGVAETSLDENSEPAEWDEDAQPEAQVHEVAPKLARQRPGLMRGQQERVAERGDEIEPRGEALEGATDPDGATETKAERLLREPGSEDCARAQLADEVSPALLRALLAPPVVAALRAGRRRPNQGDTAKTTMRELGRRPPGLDPGRRSPRGSTPMHSGRHSEL